MPILEDFHFLIGTYDFLLKVLLVTMALDYITGVCKAVYLKKLNSTIGIKGIVKKIGLILIVVLASLADYLLNDETGAIRTLIIYFFIANEAISILENWAMMGLPLPKKMYTIFEKLKNDNNSFS